MVFTLVQYAYYKKEILKLFAHTVLLNLDSLWYKKFDFSQALKSWGLTSTQKLVVYGTLINRMKSVIPKQSVKNWFDVATYCSEMV